MKKTIRLLATLLLFTFIFSTTPATSATTNQFASPALLINAIAEATGEEPTLEALYAAGYLNANEKRFIERNDLVTYALCWKVALPVYGILPYPAEFYGISPFPNRVDNSHYAEDARAAAIANGLAAASQNPDAPITTADLKTLLKQLQSSGLNPPVFKFDCPYLSGDEVWTIQTYTGRNALVLAWDKIPAAWLKDFEAEGWQIKFQLPYTPSESEAPVTGLTPGGLTNYRDRCIYIVNADAASLLHEFTHFASYRVGWDNDFLNTVYDTESAACAKILGPYSQVSPREYFAEFGGAWLDNPAVRDTLRGAAPETAQLFEGLISNYWELYAQDSVLVEPQAPDSEPEEPPTNPNITIGNLLPLKNIEFFAHFNALLKSIAAAS